MKNLFLGLLLFVAIVTKAQTVTTYVGRTVTSSDTITHEVGLPWVFNSNPLLLYILVDEDNTGTIKFRVGNYPSMNSQYPFKAGDKIPITIQNGTNNLYFKASGSGQKFVITN